MAKNKKMPTKENAEIEKSSEVLTEVSKKDMKKQAKANKNAKQEKTSKQSKQNKKKANNDKQKRSRVKETVSELKKVSWPTFKQACKQTGAVLVVVAVFMLVVLGIDSLLSWIINLIVNI